MRTKPRAWSNSVGSKPYTVRVFERAPGGMLYASAWDSTLRNGLGGYRRHSLGHRNKEAAKRYAAEQHAKLVRGQDDLVSGRTTIGRLFALYGELRTPQKGDSSQAEDERRILLFTRYLSADKSPSRITTVEWSRFVDDRRSGAISASGEPVPEKDRRRPVRNRTIEADLRFLNAVFNWATRTRDGSGRYLLRENPVRGFDVPKERNPQRPFMTQERYEALLKVSDEVEMEALVGDVRRPTRSHLTELLVLANETGRRLSAILGLRYHDLTLKGTSSAPHGVISWPADTDKQGRSWNAVPMSAEARAAIDRVWRERPGIGAAPLFPSPLKPWRPMDRYLADHWLRKAEMLAGLEPQKGSLWHAFRRKAATELKHAPDKDVMALLGWTDPRSLKNAYQHADQATMLTALETRREVREA